MTAPEDASETPPSERSVVEYLRPHDVSEPRSASGTASSRWRGSEPEVVAMLSRADTHELEVHLRRGDVRTVGRAPAAEGLVGAASATLDAWSELDDHHGLEVRWARTVHTRSDGSYVVAVGLEASATHALVCGIGVATDPVEAAARATADALCRDDAEYASTSPDHDPLVP